MNDVLGRIAQAVPLLLLGFAPGLVSLYLPFLTLFALLLHANVPWSFGPLRYVVASPAFHRWHHAADEEGLGVNLAGLFPVLDLAFGTFSMPDRQPRSFGVAGASIPEGIGAQLLFPFRAAPPAAADLAR